MMHREIIAKINSPYDKMYRRTAKIVLIFVQSDGGTIHTFHLHNLLEKKWQCLFNKQTMYGEVGVNTNPPYGKMYRRTAKIVLTFEQSNGRTIHTFHLYYSPRETEWQCTFNK